MAVDRGPLGSRLQSTALGIRDFRFLWSAQVFRGLVVWMQSLTLPWLMLEAGGTPLDVGAAGAMQFLPSAVLSPVVGAAVGAIDKRRLLLATQTMTAIATVLLLVATAAGPPRFAVYAAALVLGLVAAVDNPIRHALVGQLVPGHLVTSAVALNATVFGVTRVVGPSIAGGLIVAAGIPIALASTAIASVAGVLLLSRLRPATKGMPAGPRPRLGHALREGFDYVGSDHARSAILGSLAISVTVVGAVQAVLPVLAIALSSGDPPGSGAAVLGLMLTIIGVGALVGGLAFGFVATAPSLRVSMTASVLLSLAVVTSSLVDSRVLVLATLGAYGLLSSVAITLLNSRLQRATNDTFRARVMSLYVAVYGIATAIGSLIGGLAANLMPAHAALTVIGGGGAGIGLLLVLRVGAAKAPEPRS